MGLITIDGNILKNMIIHGANNLTRHSQELDALNVFPVPDGDTGINMSQTVQAAAREAEKLNTPNIHEVSKAASNGALRGARGNSGVILSQLFRGFAKGLEGKLLANGKELAHALVESANMAYRAVMKPKEGTILTVAKSLGEHAKKSKGADIDACFSSVIEHGKVTLEKTTEMLAELKQAGVVDSGAKGLIYFMEGALVGLNATSTPKIESVSGTAATYNAPQSAFTTESIKFAYCTEFLIDVKNPITAEQERTLTKYLMARGDSVVVVSDDTIVKIHVHTNNPGILLERALTLGELNNIKIENMRTQHTNVLEFSQSTANVAESNKPPKDTAFVAVAAGAGLVHLLLDMGVDEVIEGGQTMNPSADDILSAVSKINAKNVIILPNNKNIILSAKQAIELNKNDDVSIFVIPTETIPQGIKCLIDYSPDDDLTDYLDTIGKSIKTVHTGQVTYAVRDTVLDGHTINEGDVLCLCDGKLLLTDKKENIQQASKNLIDNMVGLAKEPEFLSIYYGEGATEAMAQEVANHDSNLEVEVYEGNQPIYPYIISVE
ncbi:MAG: DAK2 domain-containing protein [Turicibacter sp.]|nr:DAK2 domain-containing protein [Turicibacter sp.]